MLYVTALWLLLCLIVGILGRNRELGFIGNFIFAFVFTPVTMLFILLVTVPKSRRELYRYR